MSPTARQMDALRFIRGYQLAKGRAPSFGEMADGLGLKSASTAFYLVEGLHERGLVCQPYRKRVHANRNRPFVVLTDIPVPRSPDGEPLYFVRLR
jgi:SOS-response transcriptional repressor LexA